jgi:hypothetical protein
MTCDMEASMKTTVVQTTAPFTRLLNYATAAAVAIAVTAAVAAPAFAEKRGNDVVKALAAIAVFAIIANQIDKSNDDKPKPEPVRHPRVPAVCALDIDINDGQGRYFSENCLRGEGFEARLPRGCARHAEIYGRTDRIFPEWCLREAGFRTRGR